MGWSKRCLKGLRTRNTCYVGLAKPKGECQLDMFVDLPHGRGDWYMHQGRLVYGKTSQDVEKTQS